jgi:hypothetical protein
VIELVATRTVLINIIHEPWCPVPRSRDVEMN